MSDNNREFYSYLEAQNEAGTLWKVKHGSVGAQGLSRHQELPTQLLNLQQRANQQPSLQGNPWWRKKSDPLFRPLEDFLPVEP